ncbi:unnamed protein product [Dracunculus medinensis]|uniref:chitin synthase n=1 Tax=Dracunculus medinensis TaxID=318479 RepID=A0A158Q2W5_DRAME|nr:unnamed protein product [Dracunculus medinensis]
MGENFNYNPSNLQTGDTSANNFGGEIKVILQADNNKIYSRKDRRTVSEDGWDVFRLLPSTSENLRRGLWYNTSLQIIKVSSFLVLFSLTTISSVLAKSSFLLMTSAIGWKDKNVTICNDKVPESDTNTVHITNGHVVKWVWAVFLSLCAPEVICFIHSLHSSFFRNVKRPTVAQFFIFLTESLHASGLGILVFHIFPDIDVVTGNKDSKQVESKKFSFKNFRSIHFLFIFPTLLILALVMISITWWQNFTHINAELSFMKWIAKFAISLGETRSKTFVFVSIWKCLIYFIILSFFISKRIPYDDLMQQDPFGEKIITITAKNLNQTQINSFYNRMRKIELSGSYATANSRTTSSQLKKSIIDEESLSAYNIYGDYVELNQFTSAYDSLWIVLLNMIAVFLCYHSSKFACQAMIQQIGFTFPMLLAVPLTIIFLATTCLKRRLDSCHATYFLTKELFWKCNEEFSTSFEFITLPQTLLWFSTFLCQLWVTIYLWKPQNERLATNEKLFVLPYYESYFIDQSLALNRRRDDKVKLQAESLNGDDSYTTEVNGSVQGRYKSPPSFCSSSSTKNEIGLIRASAADDVIKIYVCATMWHESALEMMFMLKSIFRLDEDQCARQNAQKYLKVIDPDYYEFEVHVWFDDAFEINQNNEVVVNKFVKQFLRKINEAASAVHQTQMRLKTPKKISTPYGGQIIYILPGKNRMIIHLKNSQKVRKRKRWSQVMYLYYLLGYRLMMKVEDEARKELISENTFILTLDGDVDFSPQCVHLLIDLMKKNRRLGAACGRIHPRGSGFMIWYQKFEYAVGHWFQKATEHMIGCVLCSPGCFSLFRSLALMDDNVTRRYAMKSEQPMEYIQYDQGEDRWLCTLLLQRGYRVEYCAASDALTFAPEDFNEFFNQRRRWIPSTLANTIDLLMDYKNVISANESISIWYIIYQCVMLASSILGPGTIFLMIVGAVSISFSVSTSVALLTVTFPVAIFCLTYNKFGNLQLTVAQIIATLFALLMSAVIVGTSMQIQKDGILSPHSIFLLVVIASFIIAALLHPLEFTCIIPGVLFILAIPCMYMLLPIYSICNLNTISWGTREIVLVDNNQPLDQYAAENRNEKMFDEVWMNEIMFRRAEREILEPEEEMFWRGLVAKYLTPLKLSQKEQEQVQLGLNELRNKVSFGFFMINIVFIIIVLLLQMQKDCIHIEWPLGPKFNHTIVPCNSDTRKEVWVITKLQLEPIGLVFLAFFMSILIIQFCAMLMHRFGTLAHIIASTEFSCCKKQADRLTEDDLVVQNAVEIARELQAIRGIDDSFTPETERPISQRRVVQNLEFSRRSLMEPRTETLDDAFKKRFFALSNENFGEILRNDSRERRLTLRNDTIRAITQRRDSIFGSFVNGRKNIVRAPAQRRLERIFSNNQFDMNI